MTLPNLITAAVLTVTTLSIIYCLWCIFQITVNLKRVHNIRIRFLNECRYVEDFDSYALLPDDMESFHYLHLWTYEDWRKWLDKEEGKTV